MNTNFSLYEFLLGRPTNPWLQFLKYILCGGLSAFVMIGILFGLNLGLPSYVDKDVLSAETLSFNTNVFNTIAFIPSTLVAYFTNRFLVFTPGKHGIWVEFGIFALIATISYMGGTVASAWIVKSFSVPGYVGSLGFMVSSAMVNFICRKFIIFKG